MLITEQGETKLPFAGRRQGRVPRPRDVAGRDPRRTFLGRAPPPLEDAHLHPVGPAQLLPSEARVSVEAIRDGGKGGGGSAGAVATLGAQTR
jgi:hypothetical protein